MAGELSEQELQNIAEFTGLNPISSRQLIIKAWKANNGNIEAVVGDYYQDPEQFLKKHSWDEQAFHTDRDGGADQWRVPAFQIDAPDTTVIEGQPAPDSSFMAPARPPSRTQSPLGRLIDYASNTPDFSSLSAAVAPTSFEQEDTDLQRALAESARMSDIHSPQEAGVVNGDPGNPVFGPATREQYDPNQWAMVTTAETDHPADEPRPRDRKRAPNVPAFLRHLKDDPWNRHRLGPLMTVLHSIPAVRNGLLASGGGGQNATNYGHNKEWWKGQPIENAAGQSTDMSKYEGEAAITEPDLEHELHRLMAFLDLTDRSYGTADILATTAALSGWVTDIESKFFEDLKDRNEISVSKPMWSIVVETDAVTGRVMPGYADSASLDISHSKDRYLQCETTYDLIDATLWPSSFHDAENANDELKCNILARPADVLMIRIGGTGLQKPLKLLPVIYIDRYMTENKEAALLLQSRIRQASSALAEGAKHKEELLDFHVSDFSNPLDSRELSKKVIEANRVKAENLQSESLWRKHQEEVDAGQDSDFSLLGILASNQLSAEEQEVKSHYESDIILHEHKLTNIDRKVKKLDSEVEMCQALLKKLRGQLTDPCKEDNWNPTHSYTLRGVITGPQTMYLCKRPEEKLIVFDDDKVASEQWWTLAYLPESTEPVVVEKTTLDIVEQSLINETDNPIFIYANEAAMNETPAPLSESQHAFVKLDNRLFKQELIEETPRDRPPTGNDKKRTSVGPNSPPKRRARASSIDSMATNRASVGDSSNSADDSSLPDKDLDLPEIDRVEHANYGGPSNGQLAGFDGAFDVVDGDEGFYRHQEPDGALGTEMVQLAISRPTAGATGPVRGTEGSFQTNYIADWDNPDGKPLMVKPAKERRALDD